MSDHFSTPSPEFSSSSEPKTDAMRALMQNLQELKGKNLGPEEQKLLAEITQQIQDILHMSIEQLQKFKYDLTSNPENPNPPSSSQRSTEEG